MTPVAKPRDATGGMMRRISLTAAGFGALLAGRALAQAPLVVTGGTFTPGSTVLFATDFSQDPLGSFPKSLQYVRGGVEVVAVNGVQMLRSIHPTEFLIPLGSPLPRDFTLEFELIARDGAGNQITVEGGASQSASASSAQIGWSKNGVAIQGGGLGHSEVSFSDDVRASLVGQRVTVQVMMSGTQLRLFTDGRQNMNVPNLAFRRASVLRVTLGGTNDAEYAVYLARIRVATTGAQVVLVNQTGTTTPMAPATAAPAPSPAPTPAQPLATGTARTGAIMTWNPTTRTTPTPWPAPFATSSSLPNVPPPVQPPTAASRQALSGPTPPPPPPGPAHLAVVWAGSAMPSAWGLFMAWASVPNAVSYRVYRGEVGKVAPVPVHLTIPASDAEASGVRLAAGAPMGMLLDADYTFNSGTPIYWVDATFADGSISALSPNATFLSSSIGVQAGFATLAAPGPPNLQVVIGPPASVTVPGGTTPMPGRFLTWTWDPIFAVLYAVDVQVTHIWAWAPLYQETLLAATDPIVPGATTSVPLLSPYRPRGYPAGPPFSVGIPSGHAVRFCVAPARLNAPLAPGPYTSCLETIVP